MGSPFPLRSTAATSTTASPRSTRPASKEIPKDLPGFLELNKALKKNNTPPGFALGHASGDGNAWLHWMLWSHNAWLVDKDKIIINSPERKALEYCKALSDNFIEGCASWNDSSNNKAFLAGDLHLTANGISIYVAAKTAGAQGDAKQKAIAEDMDHAYFRWVRSASRLSCSSSSRSSPSISPKVPNTAKAFVAFMMEAQNYNPWLEGAGLPVPHAGRLRQEPGLDRRPEERPCSATRPSARCRHRASAR